MEALPKVVEQVRKEVGKGVVGQQDFIDKVVVAVLCRGHALIEGVPGIAKTLVVKLLARTLQIDFQRVQCTSDLMPADVIGGNVFNAATASFTLRKGPLFTDLLLDRVRNDLAHAIAIARLNGRDVDGRIIESHQPGEGLAGFGIGNVAKVVGTEHQRPTRPVVVEAINLAGLIGGDDELWVADGWVPAPAGKGRVRITAGRRIIGPGTFRKALQLLHLRLELDQHLAGLLRRLALLVPVGHPGADEHAEDDDGQLDADRGPVLGPQLCERTLEDHRFPPQRCVREVAPIRNCIMTAVA